MEIWQRQGLSREVSAYEPKDPILMFASGYG
jgi:hypothetical protein